MVYATLTDEMVKMLSDLKGSEFISYECEKAFNQAYGYLRINAGAGSVEVTNLLEVMPYFGTVEEIARFACIKSDPLEEFEPNLIASFKKYEVNSKITGIDIVSDEINVNNGEYEIKFDQAIIIRTEKGVIMFAKEIWWSEEITICSHDDYNSVYPVSSAEYDLSSYGEDPIEVKRTVRSL